MALTPLVRELVEMHTYCRPYQSLAETDFRNRFIWSLPGAFPDDSGNLHVVIGTAPILFSCHTDTVHRLSGRQTVHLDSLGILHLSKNSRRWSSCLGADDTVGVFLMRHMILAGVPGRYVFHSGEEQGCIGSGLLAESMPDMLKGYRAAIAFDRKDYGDVITHQCSRRTASDAFTQALADQLNGQGLKYAPSDRGLYTDTEQYADLIAECTNLSIGYSGNHSGQESVDTKHVLALLAALIAVDWSALPIDRDPQARDYTWIGGNNSWSTRWDDICVCPALEDGTVMHWPSCTWHDDDDDDIVDCDCSVDYADGQHDPLCEYYESEDESARIMSFDRDYRDDCALDPVYREVQDALRKQAKRRIG